MQREAPAGRITRVQHGGIDERDIGRRATGHRSNLNAIDEPAAGIGRHDAPGWRNDHEDDFVLEDCLDRRLRPWLGLIAMWPPEQEAEAGDRPLGRDDPRLRGRQENLPPELQHGRADLGAQEARRSRGVKEIPIRKIGGNRIEIILPQASNEEVEEVKKMLTDVGSLEFRILANRKHDAARSTGPWARRAGQAAAALQVGAAGRDLDRHQPQVHRRQPITDLQQNVEEGPLRRHRRRPDRQGRRRATSRPSRHGPAGTPPTR